MEKHEKVRKSKLSYQPGTPARIKHVKEDMSNAQEKFEKGYDQIDWSKK